MASKWTTHGVPFFFIVIFGFAALVISVLQIIERQRQSYGGLIVGLVAATVLAGL